MLPSLAWRPPQPLVKVLETDREGMDVRKNHKKGSPPLWVVVLKRTDLLSTNLKLSKNVKSSSLEPDELGWIFAFDITSHNDISHKIYANSNVSKRSTSF